MNSSLKAVLSGTVYAFAFATSAYAQGTNPDNSATEEVVVTAAKRTENAINVPMTMTVIGAVTLQDQEVKSFNDFATEVPNLSFNYGAANGAWGGNTDDRGMAIRGIQGNDTVGFYIDDLPIPISLSPRVLDIERIEVLKGPQGTLYGARSMGGTVRMITTSPDLSEFSGVAFAQGTSVDGGGKGYEVYATANVPLVTDKLALRITPYTGQDGGYINREWPTTPGTLAPLSEQKNSAQTKYSGVSASLLWEPTSNLSIRPTAIYQFSKSNGLPLGDYSASNLTNFRHFDVPEGVSDEYWIGGATIRYTLPFGSVTSATDYLHRNTRDWEDISEFTAFAFGTPLLPSQVVQGTEMNTVNEELDFTSDWNFPVQLTAGLFYNRQAMSLDFRQPIAGFVPLFGTDLAAANDGRTVTEARAVYAELTYDFMQKWSATLGMRYSEDQSDQNLYAWGLAFGPLTRADAITSITHERDTAFTPKFLLKYQPNKNSNYYADVAKGFRPGAAAFPPPYQFCQAQYSAYGLTPQELSSYKPDSVWSYELGTKQRSADNRYSVNASVFWIDWSGMQENFPLACGFSSVVNAGSARSRGAEADFTANPVEHLTLTGGIGYTDATIVSSGTLVQYPAAGAPIQNVPRWTGTFSAQYGVSLGSDLDLLLRADASYTGSSYSYTTSAEFPTRRPGYTLVALRAALNVGDTQFAFFVKNVLDEHPNYGPQYSIGGFVPDRLRWTTGVPRTFGIEISRPF